MDTRDVSRWRHYATRRQQQHRYWWRHNRKRWRHRRGRWLQLGYFRARGLDYYAGRQNRCRGSSDDPSLRSPLSNCCQKLLLFYARLVSPLSSDLIRRIASPGLRRNSPELLILQSFEETLPKPQNSYVPLSMRNRKQSLDCVSRPHLQRTPVRPAITEKW